MHLCEEERGKEILNVISIDDYYYAMTLYNVA